MATNKPVKIKDVADYLETIAPRAYQESYDNAGLITGDPSDDVKAVLATLDCTEAVVEEARQSGCNLIVAHHPILFRGVKKLTGSTYVERTLLHAIRNHIAIYAIHTNLDNVRTGVNQKIAEKIGLTGCRILAPRRDTLMKLVTFIPVKDTDSVLQALHRVGAGQIGEYKDCSFRVTGTGTFMPGEGANPSIGERNKQEMVEESRVEVIFPTPLESQVMHALRQSHPYEEVAYYLTRLENANQEVGAGMIGELETAMEPLAFLERLKEQMDLKMIRHTPSPAGKVKKVAVCGGAGSFLLPRAVAEGAHAFVTADFKYHEFFDAEDRILVADIGHYESEAFTKDLLVDLISRKFATFAVNFSKSETNPIRYYY